MAKIEEALLRGISSHELHNAQQAQTEHVRDAYNKLLHKHVTDDDIRRVMTQEHNMQKLRHRFEYLIDLQDAAGRQLARITHVGERTLQEVVNEIQGVTQGRIHISDGSPLVTQRLHARAPGIYMYRHKGNGNLGSVKITTIFRKG